MSRFACTFLSLLTLVPLGCSANEPQSGLPTITMKLGNRTFTLEVADTEDTRHTGLMNRDSMPADHGMLFIFPEAEMLSFWMKDTRIPLDILFIAADGRIVTIAQMQPLNLASTKTDELAQYAIELNFNAAAEAGIKVGDKLDTSLLRRPPATKPTTSRSKGR